MLSVGRTIFLSTITRTHASDTPVFLISTILVTVVSGITPVTSSKGFVLSSSAHSCTAICTPPVVMTLCALLSAVKYAMVSAANREKQRASTDRIKNFRFTVLLLSSYNWEDLPRIKNKTAWPSQTI